MELFAGLADMYGEGLPLSYLFVVTNAEAPPYTKEKVLVNWMEALKAHGITPEFTLSDKEPSAISALHQVWPTAKHQLCLWHVLRALKRRLANNREPPTFYGATDAAHIFPFIDSAFLPLRQMSEHDKVCKHALNIWPPHLPTVGNLPIPTRKAKRPNPSPPPRPSPGLYPSAHCEAKCPTTCRECEWSTVATCRSHRNGRGDSFSL